MIHDGARLFHLERAACCDVDQHATGTIQIDTLEQWTCHGLFGGNLGAVRARGHGGTKHGLTLLAHDRLDVFEVDVYVALYVDDFGDTRASVMQHIIGRLEAVCLRRILIHQFVQVLVKHHNQRMHVLGQLSDAVLRHLHTLGTLERKRLGDDTHGQNTQLFRDFGHNRTSACARSATHTGGNKHHVGATQGSANFLARQFSSSTALVRLGTRAQSGATQTNLDRRICGSQCLRISIAANEIDALHTRTNHMRDSIAARSADTDYFDDGTFVGVI